MSLESRFKILRLITQVLFQNHVVIYWHITVACPDRNKTGSQLNFNELSCCDHHRINMEAIVSSWFDWNGEQARFPPCVHRQTHVLFFLSVLWRRKLLLQQTQKTESAGRLFRDLPFPAVSMCMVMQLNSFSPASSLKPVNTIVAQMGSPPRSQQLNEKQIESRTWEHRTSPSEWQLHVLALAEASRRSPLSAVGFPPFLLPALPCTFSKSPWDDGVDSE